MQEQALMNFRASWANVAGFVVPTWHHEPPPSWRRSCRWPRQLARQLGGAISMPGSACSARSIWRAACTSLRVMPRSAAVGKLFSPGTAFPLCPLPATSPRSWAASYSRKDGPMSGAVKESATSICRRLILKGVTRAEIMAATGVNWRRLGLTLEGRNGQFSSEERVKLERLAASMGDSRGGR